MILLSYFSSQSKQCVPGLYLGGGGEGPGNEATVYWDMKLVCV